MSAFMVADETINRVIAWLSWEISMSRWLKIKVEDALQIDTSKHNWEETLGQAMFELNIAGVNDRYGDNKARKFRALNHRYAPTRGSKMQVLKSLQCWLYQCMEGEVIKKPFYQFFETVVEPHLMRSIISDLPEYNRAKWG